MILMDYSAMILRYTKAQWRIECANVSPRLELTFGQYKVLKLIAQGCEEMGQIMHTDIRPSTVSDNIWVADRSVVSSRVTDLTHRGLITQSLYPRDKRRYILKITDNGLKALAFAEKVDKKIENTITNKLKGFDIKSTLETLKELAALAAEPSRFSTQERLIPIMERLKR